MITHRHVPVVVAVSGALLVAGCGREDGVAKPEGWKTLKTSQVSVSYPGGWKALSKSELGEHTQAAAVLVKDGREIAKVGVQLQFISRGDAELAAGAASASLEFHGRIKGQKKITVPGTDDAQRVDYTQAGDGAPGNAPKDAEITGIDVVGVDSKDHPFLVRINATADGASRSELEKIAQSVEVTSA